MGSNETDTNLDMIIDEMIEVVENSKNEIFNISEQAREEHDNLKKDLEITKEKVVLYIEDGDRLELQVKQSRRRLSEVSKNFNTYSEFEIQRVYEQTHQMQTKLAIIQQEELALRERRDDLERRLLILSQTVERAETLASKISVVLPYLHEDFRQANDLIEDAKEKSEFSLKIINAQEDERKRISREIHDGPAQMMANIFLRSELVERAIRDRTVEEAITEIRSIRKMIGDSLREVRRIIYDLRPMALDDLGLIPTVKKYVADTEEYTGTNIQFQSLGEEKRLAQKYEVTLFRLMQESVQNAIKHGQATIVIVKMEIRKKNLSLMITDNGKGFDVTKKREESFGIIGMKERVEMLAGEFNIRSQELKGTKIYINIPYK